MKNLKIDLNCVKEITKKLFDEPNEIAGTIDFSLSKDESFIKSINTGDKTSVKTPNGFVNFHSHPITAYVQNNAVFGHPSGEDIRECIRFSMKGNFNHMVFTLEGVYTIQLFPKFVNLLIKKCTKEQRGFIICLIENYFRRFHGCRTIDFLCKNPLYSPHLFVDKVNQMSFDKLFDYAKRISKKHSYTESYIANSYGNITERIRLNKKEVLNLIQQISSNIHYKDRFFHCQVFFSENMRDYKPTVKYIKKRWYDIKNKNISTEFIDDDIILPFTTLPENKQLTVSYVLKNIYLKNS